MLAQAALVVFNKVREEEKDVTAAVRKALAAIGIRLAEDKEETKETTEEADDDDEAGWLAGLLNENGKFNSWCPQDNL